MSKRKSNIGYLIAASSITLAGACCIESEANIFKFDAIKNSIEKTTEYILEVTLLEGENIQNLSGNPDGYTKIVIKTEGDKKLDNTDFSRLKSAQIPKIDLSAAKADFIPNEAFKDMAWLTEFIYPKGVTSIGNYAFYKCSGLTGNLIIPDSVSTIGTYAFYECSGFTGDLTLGNSVETIASRAFYNCSGLTGDLIIPDSVISIESSAFYNCSGFDGALTLGNSVETIASRAFYNCSGLTGDLVIPDSVTSLYSSSSTNYKGADSSFYGCTGLTGNLVIGHGLTEIKPYTFAGTKFSELTLKEGIETIGSNAFYGLDSFTGGLTIPDSVTSIGSYAFYNCSGFTGDLTIPDSVTSIGNSAFSNCSGFDGILTLSNNLETINSRVFYNCSNLTGDLIIPDSVTSIYTTTGSNANTYSPFYQCTGLTGNLVVGSGLAEIKQYMFTGPKFSGLILKEGVKTIGSNAFYRLNSFTGDLIIPDSVISIGSSAFYNCSGFDGNLIIGRGLISLSSSAFNNVSNIQRIMIASGEEFADSNYRKSVIDNLDKSKLSIDLPYNFDTTGTWLESEASVEVVKPNIKQTVSGEEVDYDNTPSKQIVISIETPYKEDDITVLKDGEPYDLPVKIDGKYIFEESGSYELTIETITGAVSIITFEVDSSIIDFNYTEAENAVEKAEETREPQDIEDARKLVNQAPEGTRKEELQNRLNNIIPNLTLEAKDATSNLDVYIKSENMLSLSLNTNSVTFEDFSGVEDLEMSNVVNLTVSSSLPYKVNAYLESEIKNSSNNKTIDKDILNIKVNGADTYKTFTDIGVTPIELIDSSVSGKDINHGIDLKLDSSKSFEKDVYKTTIKFEAEQK